MNKGQANSLIVKLQHAINQLNTRPDKKTACNQLSAFVHEVNAYVSARIMAADVANQAKSLGCLIAFDKAKVSRTSRPVGEGRLGPASWFEYSGEPMAVWPRLRHLQPRIHLP